MARRPCRYIDPIRVLHIVHVLVSLADELRPSAFVISYCILIIWKPCMTDTYLQFLCAQYGLYPNAAVYIYVYGILHVRMGLVQYNTRSHAAA